MLLLLFTWMYQICDMMKRFFDATLVRLMTKIYLEGPYLWGYGFWGGRAPADICAQTTNIPSLHWFNHPEECWALIDKNVTAICIGIGLITCFLMIYQYFSALWYRYTLVIPLLSILRHQPPLLPSSSSLDIREEKNLRKNKNPNLNM